MRFLKGTFLLISFMFISCSSSRFMDYKDIVQKYNLPPNVDAEKYPDDDGVILLSETSMDMDLYTHTITTEENVHRVEKLFKNIEDHAFIEIPIYSSEKLERISARTVKPDGTVIELKPEEFFESKGEGSGVSFYSDRKSVKFTFPAIEKNCIIEYAYTKAKFFPFMTDVWNIQYGLPVLVNTFSLSVPKILLASEVDGGLGWDWNFKTYNYFLDKPEILDQKAQKDLGKAKVTYNWTLNNIAPLKVENMMPAVDNYRGYVKFAPSDWNEWNDISKWYYQKYFEPQLKISSSVKELTAKLTKDAQDKKDKIRALYDYVKNIRYVSISLGTGGITPSLPENVLARQYGDCKDKSMLLISMLKAADIEAQPVLVLTSDEGTLDPMFPSWNFNHMIVKVDLSKTENFWIDPTEKYAPLGRISSFCENVNALVLNPDYTCRIERIPISKTEENNQDISLNINLKEHQSSEFEACIKYLGANNSSIRYRLEDKTEKEMKEYCKSLINDEFSNAEILSYEISDADSLKSCLSLKFKGTSGKIMQSQGDLFLVASDPFNYFESTSWLIKDKREFPINFKYPFTVNKKITINLPDKYAVRNLPEKLSQHIDEISYNKAFANNGNSITVSETFKLNNPIIPSGAYADARNFFETIKNKNSEKIILIKN